MVESIESLWVFGLVEAKIAKKKKQKRKREKNYCVLRCSASLLSRSLRGQKATCCDGDVYVSSSHVGCVCSLRAVCMCVVLCVVCMLYEVIDIDNDGICCARNHGLCGF